MADEAKDQIVEYFNAFKTQRDHLLDDEMHSNYDAYKGKYDSARLKRWRKLEGQEWRSRVFVRATKMKCRAWQSTVDDIMFQGGSLPWDLKPTPMAELERGLLLPPDIAEERCDNMKLLIKDTFSEAKIDRTYRQSFIELPIYGWSWIKGPILRKFKRLRFAWDVPGNERYGLQFSPEMLLKYGRHQMRVEEFLAPVFETPSVWWVFWDLEDENPQTGQGIVDRRWYSEGMLRKLAERPGYNKGEIEKLISKYGKKKERQGKTGKGDPWREKVPDINRVFSIGEWWGKIDSKYVKGEDKKEYEEGNEIEVLAVIASVGDTTDAGEHFLIKEPTINIIPMQRRPLHMAQCEEPPHEAGGIGVASNIKDSQNMLNSLVRILLDNKALSANVMTVRKESALAPGEEMVSYPGRDFIVDDDVDDVRKAFMYINPPDAGNQLIPSINMFERYMDEESNIPRILQGETAQFNPKTAYEMSQLMQSAIKSIGTSIKNIDDNQIEPSVESTYWYFMVTSDDESIKGDYTCEAGGFNSFTETIDKGNKAAQLLTYILSNQLMLAITKIQPILKDFVRARGYDPKEVVKTDEEIAQTLEVVNRLFGMMGGGGQLPPEEETPSPESPGEARYPA
jgi:hypothetical protein